MFNSPYFFRCDAADILRMVRCFRRLDLSISYKKDLVQMVCDRFVDPVHAPPGSAWDNFPEIMKCLKNFLECMENTGMTFEIFDKYSALMTLYWIMEDKVGRPGLWDVCRNLDDQFRHAIDYDSDTPTIDMDSDSDTIIEAFSDTD